MKNCFNIKQTGFYLFFGGLLLAFIFGKADAQSLSFGTPVNILPAATSNKTPCIAYFKDNFFVAWIDKKAGKIHVADLGKQPLKGSVRNDDLIDSAQSNFAPIFCVTPNHLYVLWINHDGGLNYVVNTSDNCFKNSKVDSLEITGASIGLSCAVVGNNMLIASRSESRDVLIYTVAAIGTDGLLTGGETKDLSFKSTDYPAVVALADSVRLTWRGNKDQDIYYANGDFNANKWTKAKKLNGIQSGTSPAVLHNQNSTAVFYISRGIKKDTRLYYTMDNGDRKNFNIQLPGYLNVHSAVSICVADKNNFYVAYAGPDDKIYLSAFVNYNPAKWMEQTLFPKKANYSLKDIIMPGSHDAGMSVLTATGGQQKGTINECNVLTQIQNIKGQLNSGMRMFDLRIGLYKDSLYAKHASSDCMDDAIGGGFGEKFSTILHDLKDFLNTNKKETVVLSFSHFCTKEASMAKIAQFIIDSLGKEHIYANGGKKLSDVTLNELAGKAIMVFEGYATPDKLIDSCTIAATSNSFINFKREYAATNNLDNLKLKEKTFFTGMGSPLKYNDLVRLDWQLTQGHDEAAMVCNSFQDESINPLFSGVMALTSAIRKHHSIIDLAKIGNQSVLLVVNEWLANKTINKINKPNVLYVDAAGAWATDYCVQLNMNELYTK
ncbi:hypothetical protein KXD93_08775 [Mucilaginibacter sp. BJC16-A38]|uniref:phosphatidylinositol-specific phospholipase C domain-containing protein n=1 Tax=Mucilaginibacter phenanthrenivorans TaxID=1234842 RepID=UPI0021589078|nr:phosphatidylinositol-specific phospholipase C domain-containing protein [Mucilaginibacter phenanthrenivorans]MCR8557733.1 hypothetical protein [Mucilaginibacter phenanthrenivorans]